MTTPAGPEGGAPDPGLAAIMSERRQLINLAYRLLDSLAEAEDAVQETYARWYAMNRQQQEAIESPGAWLTKVASRICLYLLGSARTRRERYVGEWIPEPLPERAEWVGARPSASRSFSTTSSVISSPTWPASSAVPRRPAASWPPPPAAASAHRRSQQPRPRSRPASSGTSRRHGRPGTSTPSSASSTQTPRRSPTAAASSPPNSARSKAPSRSPAAASTSPTWHPP